MNSYKINITHLTSAHPRYDTRIFEKMCKSLSKIATNQVSLIVADGRGFERIEKVDIIDIGKKSDNRMLRMLKTVNQIYLKALELDSDIYHLHDPELIPIGLKLKKNGKKVIFDAHEDLPKQILSKPYLTKIIRIILSYLFTIYEQVTCKKFDYIITATPNIRDKFLCINQKVLDVNNYPIIGELDNDTQWSDKKNEVCYIGGISKIRGIREVIKSLSYIEDIKLNLAGNFNKKDIEEEVKSYQQWNNVNEYGFLDRVGVMNIMSKSKAGLVTLYPTTNYTEALPVKMFEYMIAGLPVISSNILLWKSIIEKNDCGVCVDPYNPEEIANAISYIINNPDIAEQMGQNGKKAILEKYNWQIEEKKLYKIYEGLAKNE